ncbi:MAG: GNAT family N-acetyltransferase [Rikenellaceae bacterium]|nr:GNAT family N-acetyltransferase [Rikenellaceae bacterium]
MEIKPLACEPFDSLFGAFASAFADYEMQLDKEGFAAMLRRRGFDPALSFAAFDGGRIVAFTLNGTGQFDGKYTAYDTGTGTLKVYRGRGLATRIFEHSIPYLREAGIGQYLLEVLQHNTRAVTLYRTLGFEVSREFHYFRQSKDNVLNNVPDLPACRIETIDTHRISTLPDFGDFTPSWQNSSEAIARSPEDFTAFGVYEGTKLIGRGIFEPASGDITSLAVDAKHRRKGVGSLLFGKMLSRIANHSIKIINTDTRCEGITAFLCSKNIFPAGKQYEMIKRFDRWI